MQGVQKLWGQAGEAEVPREVAGGEADTGAAVAVAQTLALIWAQGQS